MVNTSDFSLRLQQIIDYYGLTASAFADSLDIQRSSISHLLSERNKPSLDFILKLVETYPEVDIYWITKGKGVFPAIQRSPETKQITDNKSVKSSIQMDLFTPIPDAKTEAAPLPNTADEPSAPAVANALMEEKKPENRIKKIIFFYENNQFEIFENK
ncbi:MAG: helix-turn-helix transcriptional regulator [Capnocytophaga sp.]|nr:helix-turn-helix transcriptional regulator [Capnocytophaga sp.]